MILQSKEQQINSLIYEHVNYFYMNSVGVNGECG